MDTIKILIIGYCDYNLSNIKKQLQEFRDDWIIVDTLYDDVENKICDTCYNVIIFECSGMFQYLFQEINNLKASKYNHETPILVCVDNSNYISIEEVIKAEVHDFIQMPFKPFELFTRIMGTLKLSYLIRKSTNQKNVIDEKQQRIEAILNSLLPAEIINELTIYGESKPKKYHKASVLFIDLVDFTRKSSSLSPRIVIDELSDIFSSFDYIIKKNGCLRIKTIGDGYLAVSGIPKPNEEHAINLLEAAIEMREYLKQRNKTHSIKWNAKMGINSGEVIGSVLGGNNMLFDVFGDTVNTAARMENECEANQINVSSITQALTKHKYKFIGRTPLSVKSLGVTKMYYLNFD